MQKIIYGVDPCPWCGSQFRVVDLDQPNLIQCDDCRHDEKIDPSEVSEYERERLEKMKRELLTTSQLSNLFRLKGLGEDSIKLYAEAITLPKVWIDNKVYFYPKHDEEWVKGVVETRLNRQS